jgi:hypothetical protein
VTVSAVVRPEQLRRRAGGPGARLTRALAFAAVPILAIESWTVGAWLIDGPHSITKFRDTSSVSWYAAHTLEAINVIASVAVIVHLVRDCRRQRRLFTFDVMFCIAGATMFWANSACNFFQPTFLVSSNFVNLNNACGYIPFISNHNCAAAPDPTLFLGTMETFCILGLSMIAANLARRAWLRWPTITPRRMTLSVLAGGVLVDLLLEPLSIRLKLWDYPAPGWMSMHLDGLTFPVLEVFAGGLWFGALMAVRVITDSERRHLVERGLDDIGSPALRRGVSMLALYAFFQLVIWVVASVPLWTISNSEPSYAPIPKHIVNGVCDAPGRPAVTGIACP